MMRVPDRVQEIVKSVVGNPEQLVLIQQDPQRFLASLALTPAERLAIGAAGGLLTAIRQRVSSSRRVPEAQTLSVMPVETIDVAMPATDTVSGGGDPVALTAIAALMATLSIAAIVGTVAVVAGANPKNGD